MTGGEHRQVQEMRSEPRNQRKSCVMDTRGQTRASHRATERAGTGTGSGPMHTAQPGLLQDSGAPHSPLRPHPAEEPPHPGATCNEETR